MKARASLIATLLVVSVTTCVSAVLVQRPPSPLDRTTRHTLTRGWYLVPAEDGSSVVFLMRFSREIWISPDGSGRLIEQYLEQRFPSSAEREQWAALGQPKPIEPINTFFAPGGLMYWSLAAVPSGARDLHASLLQGDPSPGEILTRVSSLLWETAPPDDLVLSAIDALRLVRGLDISETGGTLIASGLDGDDPRKPVITLEFDTLANRLTRDRRSATAPIDGVDGTNGPITYLDQSIVVSETLPNTTTPTDEQTAVNRPRLVAVPDTGRLGSTAGIRTYRSSWPRVVEDGS